MIDSLYSMDYELSEYSGPNIASGLYGEGHDASRMINDVAA